ncbi:LysE family translocator [Methyloligella sp. 2.7D]|uniref:LysE family translocator n=1 Tax=unclassified Methyloligella TaxID=2625955 RepID=UPI00157BCAD7|nr:LysE family translocator [Methyloligella sp. GL2]QKP76716.1 LysE family translocator [Methyloligella sp. GL2]
MDTAIIAPLALYIFVMAITPGPNNMMLATSGLIFGMKRTLPHLFGIPTGGGLQIAIVGAGLGAAFAYEPRLQLAIKVGGTFYLLYLAWKLWRAAGLPEATASKPITFLQAAAFQFANPKAWVLAVTAVAAYTTPGPDYVASLILVVVVCMVSMFPCSTTWLTFGATLRRFLKHDKHLIMVNRTLAVMTALTGLIFWI